MGEDDTDYSNLEVEIQPYSYPDQILTTDELGVKVGNSWSTIGTDFSGLMAYLRLLLLGGGKAQKNCKGDAGCTKPLGDRVLIKTIGKCKDKSGELVTRSILINNIPDGSIPFIPGTKGTFPKGLIPGVLKNMDQMNPLPIFKSFTEGSQPDCTAVKLNIIDNVGEKQQTAYIADSEVKDIDACTFAPNAEGKQINPLTKKLCQSGFTNRYQSKKHPRPVSVPDPTDIPDDPFIKLYYASIGLLMMYIMTNYFKKIHKKK